MWPPYTQEISRKHVFSYMRRKQNQSKSTVDVYSDNFHVGILTTLATDGSSVIQATPVL